ncbi:glycosyltransferase family 4 protein [Desulfobulbus sp. F4]|nr:glycosyltransferase family 4 protein [Desulfobulbus sp. F4]
MNICMVVWKFHPCPEGGAERQCRRLAAELTRQGHRCEVLTSRLHTGLLAEEVMPEGFMVQRLGKLAWLEEICKQHCRAVRKKLPLPERLAEAADFWLPLPVTRLARFSFMLALRQFFKQNCQRIDVIHVHEAHWIAGAVVWACQGLHLPVVCKEATFPSSAVINYDAPLRSVLARCRRQAKFIALTETMAESLRTDCGISAERISIIPNGVELPETASPVVGSHDVLYIGNFSQGSCWKAFDILFEAWVLFQRHYQGKTRLVVLGAGDSASWRQYLEEHGCSGSVYFAGAVQDVGEHLRKARLFVLPSRVEGLSNALLEAMSWGLPTVVSDIQANKAVVRHQENGWVVPVNDSKALADAMRLLLADEPLSLRLGQSARQTITEQYTISRVARLIAALYRKL